MGACAIVESARVYGRLAVPEAKGDDIQALVVDSVEAPTRPEYEASRIREFGLWHPCVLAEGEIVPLAPDHYGRDLVSIGPVGRFQRALIDVVRLAHPTAVWSAGGDPESGGVAVAKIDGRIVGAVMGCLE